MLVNKCLNKDFVIIMHRNKLLLKAKNSWKENGKQREKLEEIPQKLVDIKDHGLTIREWKNSKLRKQKRIQKNKIKQLKSTNKWLKTGLKIQVKIREIRRTKEKPQMVPNKRFKQNQPLFYMLKDISLSNHQVI